MKEKDFFSQSQPQGIAESPGRIESSEADSETKESIPLPPGIFVPDTAQFPDLQGWYEHPIAGWVEGDPVQDALSEGWLYDKEKGWIQPVETTLPYEKDTSKERTYLESQDYQQNEVNQIEALPATLSSFSPFIQNNTSHERFLEDSLESESLERYLDTLNYPQEYTFEEQMMASRKFCPESTSCVDKLLKVYYQTKNYFDQARIINALGRLHTQNQHHKEAETALLSIISDKNASYLTETYAQQIIDDVYEENFKHWYNDKTLKENCIEKGLLPHGSTLTNIIASYGEENYINDSSYSRLAPGYIVIYSPWGTIDSFLNTQEGINPPKYTDLDTILTNEGYQKSSDEMQRVESLYSRLLYPPVRKALEDALRISLEKLDIRTQLQLLNFLSEADPQTVTQAEWFLHEGALFPLTKEQTADRLVTFLALENQSLSFQDIVMIDAEFGETVAQEIFRKYAEIHSLAMRVFQEVAAFTKTPQERAACLSLRNNLLSKASGIIVKYVEKAREASEQDRKSPIVFTGHIIDRQNSLLQEISSIRTDIEFFRMAFKELHKRGGVTEFSEISGVEFNAISGQEIRDEDRQAMREIYARNYTSDKYPVSFRDSLLESFDRSLENEHSVFYVVKRNGRVIAFNRFDHLEDGSVHFGAFNVDLALAGASIGDALFRASMDSEKKHPSRILAECDSREGVSTYYINNGFVATDIEIIDGTVPAFRIEWAKSAEYATKNMSLEAIGNLPKEQAEHIIVKKFDTLEERDFSPLKQGYVLTRYYINPKTQESYCVFEKKTKE